MGEVFGRTVASAPYWEQEAATYQEQLRGSRSAYHDGRLETARRLLARAGLPAGARIVDFGCGDGVLARELAARGHTVRGLDIADAMIALARDGAPAAATFAVGGAHDLADHGPCDALVSLNVLAYLTDDESAAFWRAARAIVKPGGALLVSHSNELFDLFALNAGTASFFARHLTDGRDVAPLLTNTAPAGASYNVRANPLTYAATLAREGFEEEAQAFFNLHPLPPALLGAGDQGRVVDPDAIAAVEPWRQSLQCSTYFSLARRVRE